MSEHETYEPKDPKNVEIESLSEDDLESVSGGNTFYPALADCNSSTGTCNCGSGTCG